MPAPSRRTGKNLFVNHPKLDLFLFLFLGLLYGLHLELQLVLLLLVPVLEFRPAGQAREPVAKDIPARASRGLTSLLAPRPLAPALGYTHTHHHHKRRERGTKRERERESVSE